MIDVALYALFEVTLSVPVVADNPYDPVEISVVADIHGAHGEVSSWPAFWDGAQWVLRYRPMQMGVHSVEVRVDGDVADTWTFSVGLPEGHGPIRAEGYGFRHVDGTPFVPIGLNLGWSIGEAEADYQRWFSALSAAGGTFARVWVTHISQQNPQWSDLERMDPAAAQRIDDVLDAAAEQDIGVMLVLWQHSQLETTMWSSWDANPYNDDNGGPCADSTCFFTDATARSYQDRTLRYAVARWGAHPALAAWEVINEVDGVSGVGAPTIAAWASSHADALRSLEDGLHPVSWSYALPAYIDTAQHWDGADFTQVHSYLFTDVDPVARGVGAALSSWDKPVLVGEWGLDWFGNADRADTEGLSWHNASWAAVASGSAGNALAWWWDDHVEPDDLWHRVSGVAAVSALVDLPSMGPIEVSVSVDEVEAFGRAGAGQALVWVHDTESTVDAGELSPQRDVSLHLEWGRPACAHFYDTVSGELIEEGLVDGEIAIPTFRGDVAIVVHETACLRATGCGCGGGGPVPLHLGGLGIALVALASRRRR